MNTQLAIRDHVRRLVAGELSVAQFEDWFIPATWDVDTRQQTAESHLVRFITARLADLKDGELTEQAFLQALEDEIFSQSASG